jgi:TolB-like protein
MTEPSKPEATAGSGREALPQADSAPPIHLWERIKEHKVLQWGLAYLGASLALAHGQELLSHTYHWPELTGRVLLGVLIVGFPVALTLAWYHGHKGLKQISAGELTVISILILIGAGLLTVLVRAPAEPVTHSPAPVSTPMSAAPSANVVKGQTATTASLPSPALAAKKPRLAILPFENLSPDPANAFFTDGLHEEILATLAQRAPGLEVISRTTMMMYRLKPKSVAEVARELGATHVIEGSVRRDGQQVRLTLQLIDARTDDHLWAQDYDRTLTHALTLQSEVANAVAAQLSVQIARGAEGAKPLTRDPEAYDLYLKALLGRGAALATTSPDAFADAFRNIDELLTAAIARDPSFAAAYAERSPVRLSSFLGNLDTSEEPLRRAREDVETAERLAPADPKVIAARAVYRMDVDQDRQGALAGFAAAEAAGLADPMWIALEGETFVRLGRCDEGISVFERTLLLDPRNPWIVARMADTLAACHRPIEAVRTLDSAIRQLPDAAPFRRARAYVVFAFTGNTDALNALPAGGGPAVFQEAAGVGIDWEFDRLRWTHRNPELQQLLAHIAAPVLPTPAIGAGDQPTARYRGWMHLLQGDRREAAKDGTAVLHFVAYRKETQWNRLSLREITAEGYTFAGEPARAIAAARSALELVPAVGSPWDGLRIAAVYAWSGAEDQAVELLEHIATRIPGPGPAEIARDPLYTVPLAHNARYQQLNARLEAQMRAMKLR